jgi:catechol 2,3-dioxygenase-like lactoylglutathione lyase family enzyme
MSPITLCLLLPMLALAQATAQPTSSPAPFSARGAFFALSVADVQASVRWYTEKLNLAVVMEQPKRDGAAVAILEGHGLIVELVELDAASPLGVAAPKAAGPFQIHGVFKAGVIVDDFDRLVAMIKTRNVEIAHGPFPARNGQRANVIVRDNAGNLIQFFAR